MNETQIRTFAGARPWRAIPVLSVLLAVALAAAADPALVRGRVLDPEGEPVAGARVRLDGERRAETDGEGRFVLPSPPGEVRLEVEHPAFQTLVRWLRPADSVEELELRFDTPVTVTSTITVVGIRADRRQPVTTRELAGAEIATLSYGQDVPELLEHTPSITWYSDSGTGSNYSYFSLRGIQQTRINMTFDGAPLNDPAEHAVYFNNFHGFADAVDSVQVQRGVGTSSVGSPSFGGSVNFASPTPSEEPGGDVQLVLGSYDTRRASASYESGRTEGGFFVSGRLAYADTEGYRERSGSEHRTLFVNAGWQGERSSLKLVSFAGNERSQLAYLAVDPETLSRNRRFNPLSEDDRDDFSQRFAQLQYTRAVKDDLLMTASLYYNGADGWFRLRDGQGPAGLLEFGIDQEFVGSVVTVSKEGDRLSGTAGVHYNDFQGDHTLDIQADRIYANRGLKQTANAFVKLELSLGRWLLFGDLQLRQAEFSYRGDLDLGSVEWRFFDPKIGVRRSLTPRMSFYASLGRAQREPARLDLLQGEDNATVRHDLEAVRPEEVIDLEAGIDFANPRLSLQANLYAMEFTDEIALTGELSEVGLPLRRNVDDSYRRGLELDLRWRARPQWQVTASANLSRNRIESWTQFYDVYDEAGRFVGSEPITYRDVPPLLTPEAIVNLTVERRAAWGRAALSGRWVDGSQLDNTGLDRFRLPSYTNLDLRASLDLGRWWPAAGAKLTLFVNNLLDSEEQYPGGYSYQFLVRGAAGGERLDGLPYYYPRATRNALLSLELDL